MFDPTDEEDPMATRTAAKKKASKKTAPKKTAPKKTAKVKPIPSGYHSATPYLIVDGAGRAIEFYKRAFGAKELMRIPAPGDRVGHAEVRIGSSVIMLADEHPEMDARGPRHYGGSPVSLLLYVADVDKQFQQALTAGGTEVRPVADQFYGDRAGTLKDPFGHTWHIHTHKEDVSPAELNRRMAAMKK
jgi:PhnB protein